MALIAAHLNAGIIVVVTVYRQVYNLPLPPPPYPPLPFPPSLISLMVSVDVKHHVYFAHDVPRHPKGRERVKSCDKDVQGGQENGHSDDARHRGTVICLPA